LAACATSTDGGGGRNFGASASALAWPATDMCQALRTPCVLVNTDAAGKITGLTEFNTGNDAKVFNVFGPNNFIIWIVNPTVGGPNVPFAGDGISFANPPAGNPGPPSEEFSCRPYLAGKIFACVDRNATPGKFYYYVRLQNGSNLDPYVVNN
jgi:hypothetical protein